MVKGKMKRKGSKGQGYCGGRKRDKETPGKGNE
jgi:hypothetical protein